MASFSPYESGGVTGGEEAKKAREALLSQMQSPGLQPGGELPLDPGSVPKGDDLPEQPVEGVIAGAPDYTRLGQYAGKLQGYDMGKFNNPYDQWSEKYKIGAVQSHFDPRQGVTKEYLDALNSLGIAGFSGEGDQLMVQNTKNDPRFGRGGSADVVKGLKGNNDDTAWQPWFVDEGGGGGGAASPAGGVGPDLTQYFQGGVGHLMDSNFLKQLMDKARGIVGPAATDRNALLSLLGN